MVLDDELSRDRALAQDGLSPRGSNDGPRHLSSSPSESGDAGSLSDRTYASIKPSTPSVSSGNESSLAGRNPQETEPLCPVDRHPPHRAAQESLARDLDDDMAAKSVGALKAANTKLQCVFCATVLLCVVVAVSYVVAIVCFVIRMQQSQPLSSSSAQSSFSSASGRPENCVDLDRWLEFKKLWDPEESRHFTQDVKQSYTIIDNKFCFHGLQWLPIFMGKMNAAVSGSVKDIEDKQTKINETVNKYLVNSTEKQENSAKQSVHEPVYAHFFLDTQDKGSKNGTLLWCRDGTSGSSKRGVDVRPSQGKFVIRHSGFYFVYAHVTFGNDVEKPTDVYVVKKEKSVRPSTTLLKTDTKPASLQGVFILKENDELTVKSMGRVYTGSRLSTYFGLYLMRA